MVGYLKTYYQNCKKEYCGVLTVVESWIIHTDLDSSCAPCIWFYIQL